MYLTWNAVILGNAGGGAAGASSAAAVVVTTALSSHPPPSLDATTRFFFPPSLSSSVAVASELAVLTSLVGVVLGFVNEFNDAIGRAMPLSSSSSSSSSSKWNVALLTLSPPAVVSIALGYYSSTMTGVVNDIADNYQIVDYTGIFGSSVLFMILPALMAWNNRYGEEDPPRPLTVRPMVPLGKIPLGSLYKAAGTLIVEQGLDKIGLFEFVREHIFSAL
jgi:tyrosine-specific transport protein